MQGTNLSIWQFCFRWIGALSDKMVLVSKDVEAYKEK